MEVIKQEELEEIKGGFSLLAGLGIAAIIVFAVGVISGIVHPKSCSCNG